ncbi:MAG: DUF58 domain-containing protein [Candidatus Thermoplasmatota archaeon]
MKSNTNFILVTLTILTLFIGIIIDSWVFFILAIANFSLLALGNRSIITDDVRLRVERKTQEMSVYRGDEVRIDLSIKNHGKMVKYLEVLDIVPSDAQVVKGSNHQILKLEENEEKKIRYKISCNKRGKTEIGPVKLRYRSPLNLNVEEWTSKKILTIFVLPSIQKMESMNIRPLYTRNWIGNVKSQSMGLGSEFFSLREYRAEDEIKRINWKATARYLEPVSNEYIGERSGDVIIVVDGYGGSNIGGEENNTIDASVQAAGTLASSILADRNRVGLIILGDFLDWLYPDFGRDHFYKVMEKLSEVKEGGLWRLKDTEWVLKRFFPERSMIIFISPLISEKISETIVDICMKEYNVMVISPNPIDIEKEMIDDHNVLAEKLSSIERGVILEKLWKYSIVVDWNPNEPLEAGLDEVIRYWKRS